MRSIAFDIGENSVKIVDLIEHKKNIVLQSFAEKKLSQVASDHDKEIEAIEFVRNYLASRENAKDSSPPRFIMGIRQDRVTVRTKIFPFTDRSKITKSLPFEMEDDIPFDPDQCIFDFKIIKTVGPTAHVLAVAVQKTHIEKCLSLAKDFGVELHAISVEGFAFANLVETWNAAPPSEAPESTEVSLDVAESSSPHIPIELVIHFGHRHTLIAAFSSQRMVYIRSAMWGADAIIQELVRKFQLPYADAQKLLQTQAELLLSRKGVDFDQQNLASTIEKPLRDLVRELQITILEIQSLLKTEIKSIYLSGGLSHLGNIAPHLTQHIEIACNPTTLTTAYFSSLTVIQSDVSKSPAESISATAIGLGLEAFKKGKNPALQLIRGEFIGDSNKLKNFWQEWGSVATISVLIFAVLMTWSSFRHSYSTLLAEESDSSLKKQARSLLQLPRKEANERGVKKFISENKKRIREMRNAAEFAKMNSALDLIKQISETAPDRTQINIDLQTVSIVDEKVELEGYANSPREITIFLNKIAGLAKPNTSRTSESALPQVTNRVSFKIELDMDRGITKAPRASQNKDGGTE